MPEVDSDRYEAFNVLKARNRRHSVGGKGTPPPLPGEGYTPPAQAGKTRRTSVQLPPPLPGEEDKCNAYFAPALPGEGQTPRICPKRRKSQKVPPPLPGEDDACTTAPRLPRVAARSQSLMAKGNGKVPPPLPGEMGYDPSQRRASPYINSATASPVPTLNPLSELPPAPSSAGALPNHLIAPNPSRFAAASCPASPIDKQHTIAFAPSVESSKSAGSIHTRRSQSTTTLSSRTSSPAPKNCSNSGPESELPPSVSQPDLPPRGSSLRLASGERCTNLTRRPSMARRTMNLLRGKSKK